MARPAKPQPATRPPRPTPTGVTYLLKDVGRDSSFTFSVGVFPTLEAAQRHADPAGTREWSSHTRWGGYAYWFTDAPATDRVLEIETVPTFS
jgi:hypothetical protein